SSLIGRSLSELVPAETLARVIPYVRQVLNGTATAWEEEVTVRTHGGETQRHVHGSYTPDRDEEGRVRGFYAIITDITERRRSEIALAESEDRFRSMADATPAM